ncbi:MAG: hypothetical protein ALECFALPRED_010502 [Alectoria fallacina]|uniref:Uncharacterized protein n=1 Tax=Alectoria fallacina TaxID=1903189 RepID=A0A8H3J8Z1_9LECA|nr:MAG: hypothetical protein ALECFALPRED_010502 [Alectoria fallacina]
MGEKALCYVQPVLIGHATSARATTNQVRNAAAAIRHRCASGGNLQGGIATNIGGDNNLAVIMGAYRQPSAIQCRGTFQPVNSCQDVLEDMPATTKAEVFAPPDNSSATVLLPQAVESDDALCLLRIFGTPSDTASWYELWEATTAIWSVCTRQSRGGSLGGIGESRDRMVVGNSGLIRSGLTGDHGSLLLVMTAQSAVGRSLPRKGPGFLIKTVYYGSVRFAHIG